MASHVENSELITVCRQIASMMEAGVDILRITRVLRAQTDNPRLLEAYNNLDHDLTMGLGLADAMSREPDVWSPFAVSLVQQGEARNDLAGAFNQFADFLQKEESNRHEPVFIASRDSDTGLVPHDAPITSSKPAGTSSPLTVIALDGLIDRLQMLGLRSLTLVAGLLLALATVWWMVEMKFIEPRWINVTLCSVAALFMGGAGVVLQKRISSSRKREVRCSFCGVYSPSGMGLERAPRFDGAAICPRCAAIIAHRHGESLEAWNGSVTQSGTVESPLNDTANESSGDKDADGSGRTSSNGSSPVSAPRGNGSAHSPSSEGTNNGSSAALSRKSVFRRKNGGAAPAGSGSSYASSSAAKLPDEEDYE